MKELKGEIRVCSKKDERIDGSGIIYSGRIRGGRAAAG